MSTSLAEQLQRLAVPESSILVDRKKKASILFTESDAATKDRRTFFDIGHSGLIELIRINPELIQFERTLFDVSTISFQRSVENEETNKKLNQNIKKFFQHVSPFFMLHPAHKCLEWLIQRFQIHEYNKDDFIGLILPYHETKIFVKCLQTLRLRKNNDPWAWLQPLQKPGLPLSKTMLLKRISKDNFLLKFISKSAANAIKELGPKAHLLQAHINFYCISIVGSLEVAHAVNESHILAILPSIVYGLSSTCIDFVSANFMIISQLVTKLTVSTKLLNTLIQKISCVNFEKLRNDIILLLILIGQSQKGYTVFPKKHLLKFISLNWVIPTLTHISTQSVSVEPLCLPLFNACIQTIAASDDTQEVTICKEFLISLQTDIDFSIKEIKNIFSILMESINCFIKISIPNGTDLNCSVINLDSDDDMMGNEKCNIWYSEYLQSWERQFPKEFDQTLKEQLKENDSEIWKQTLNYFLGNRLTQFSNENDDTKIFENLYHNSAMNRIEAVKFLVSNFHKLNDLSPTKMKLLKESLADRLNDDNPKVVLEVLKLSSENLLTVLDGKQLCEMLFNIFEKIHLQESSWDSTINEALIHLTNRKVFNETNPIRLQLALLPFILPLRPTQNSKLYLQQIMSSDIIELIPFVKDQKAFFQSSDFSIEEFSNRVTKNLTKFVAAEDILLELKNINSIDKGITLSYLIKWITVCFKENSSADVSLSIFNQVWNMLQQFEIVSLAKNNPYTNNDDDNKIPLYLVLEFMTRLVENTDFKDFQFNYDTTVSTNNSMIFIIRIYEILCRNAFESKNNRAEYATLLKNSLNSIFKNQTKQILSFLANFYNCEQLPNELNDISLLELRIRSTILFKLFITKSSDKNLIDQVMFTKILIALSSENTFIRECALDTFTMLVQDKKLSENNLFIAEALLRKSEELRLDSEQLALIIFMITSKKSVTNNQAIGGIFLKNLIKLIDDTKSDNCFRAQIFEILKHANGTDILNKFLEVGIECLENPFVDENGIPMLTNSKSKIYLLIVNRFNENTLKLTEKSENAWKFLEKALCSYNILVHFDNLLQPVAGPLISQIDNSIFTKLPNKYKNKLIQLVIDVVFFAENDNITLCVNRLFKKITLNGDYIFPILEAMNQCCYEPNTINTKRKLIACQSEMAIITNTDWKKGITFLELIENKKIDNSVKIVPILFEILKKCLDFEDTIAFEYTKQLILSSLLEINQQCRDVISENTAYRIDLIVQCVRATQNHQTHHYASRLMSQFAKKYPQLVLHNMMDIFTFMGSTIMRQEDEYGFQIISDIISNVIPIIVKNHQSSNNEDNFKAVIPVFKVFADIILDVPEHRRLALYGKLLTTIDAKTYLWTFLCVLFESHVIHNEKDKSTRSSGNNKEVELPKRLEFAMQLSKQFDYKIILETCCSLLSYIKHLPITLKNNDKNTNKMEVDDCDETINIFDIKTLTEKQYRHYKYIILQFISTITFSNEFISATLTSSDKDSNEVQMLYKDFIMKIIIYIPDVTAVTEMNAELNQSKYWKVLMHHCYDILDNAVSLLTPEMFIQVVHGLMKHKLLTVRKKMIDLLINKLQHRSEYFDNCDASNFVILIEPLNEIIATITDKKKLSNEVIFMQQTALIAIKVISKKLAFIRIDEFKSTLNQLILIVKNRSNISKIIISTVMLTIIEVASNLKAHCLGHLPKFMPILIEIMQDQIVEQANTKQTIVDNIYIAFITGIQKLSESLALFLGPYLVDIIVSITTIWNNLLQSQATDERTQAALLKLSHLWKRLTVQVPFRVLLPNCKEIFKQLFENKIYRGIGIFMKLLLQYFKLGSGEFVSNQNEMLEFFMCALEFRTNLSDSDNSEEIYEIEQEIIDAFVTWILKLSESSFRPLYHKIYDWGIRQSSTAMERNYVNKDTVITYFILAERIGQTLKSLYVLFAGDFIEDAAYLLNACNKTKSEKLFFADENEMWKNCLLVKSILKTLYNIFMYDSKGFINAFHFDILMQPIIDQLDNTSIIQDETILINCIAELATAANSDVLWKQLNYHVLLKTRSNVPEVRIMAFNCCVEIARKLNDEFSALLPDTIPFMAELFEDDNIDVESNAKKGVQKIEEILGESLQNYF